MGRLALQVCKAKLARLDRRVTWAQLGLQAHKVILGRQGRPAVKVIKEILALPAQPAFKAKLAQLAIKVSKATLALPARKACKVSKESKGCRVR